MENHLAGIRRFGSRPADPTIAGDYSSECPGHDSLRGHPGFHWPGFHWTVLRRHGKRPLAVLGRALLEANNRCAGLHYWSEISIHETSARRFAACVRHAAPGADGPAWCDTWLCDSPEAVRTILCEHDPLVALPSCIMPNPLMPAGRRALGADLASGDAGAAQRFLGAWAGLLAAIFGLSAAHRPPA
jgi:hypothetical protein